jgi:hypothetical protein
MIPLYAIGIGATVWAALVVGLSLTSFKPSIRRTYRAPTLREQLRALDARVAK